MLVVCTFVCTCMKHEVSMSCKRQSVMKTLVKVYYCCSAVVVRVLPYIFRFDTQEKFTCVSIPTHTHNTYIYIYT